MTLSSHPAWDHLPDEVQLALARDALHRAAGLVTRQAEVLADQIEAGLLADRGGAEALRLLAAVMRATGSFPTAGCA